MMHLIILARFAVQRCLMIGICEESDYDFDDGGDDLSDLEGAAPTAKC